MSKKKERILLWLLTLVYAVIAFVNLGDTAVPQTRWEGTANQQVTYDLPEDAVPVEIWHYGGISNANVGVYAVEAGEGSLVATAEVIYDNMFRWHITELEPAQSEGNKYVLKMYGDVWLNELIFVDAEGNAIVPEAMTFYDGASYVDTEDILCLVDEHDLKPERPTAQNGMYFDELYHGRTALEHLEGMTPYENSHPPLGKILIMVGIALFGMTPFGWRFSGAFLGVLMVPVFYMLLKRITKSQKWSFFGTALFTFDFMHYAQTRLATIDVFVVFFIMLMYYFMLRYIQRDFYAENQKKNYMYLGLSGVCFGLGAATKWTGIYAGGGLAVIFFAHIIKKIIARRRIVKAGDENLMEHTAACTRTVIKTLLFCVLTFIVIPVGIYLASYLPYMLCETPYSLEDIWKVQEFMFGYHSGLTATHGFSSQWYSWPLDVRPIWYYMGTRLPEGAIASIASFGNPVVWWSSFVGLVALIITRLRGTIRNKKAATFVLIGFAAQFLPWVLVSRATFIYHYFPSVPFIVMALTMVMQHWEERGGPLAAKTAKIVGVALPIIAVALFAMFYPILSGVPVSREYASLLTWFHSWTFFV